MTPKPQGQWLRDLGYEVKPGECTFCGDAVPQLGTKPAFVCKDDGCKADYARAWAHQHRGQCPRVAIRERERLGSRLWRVLLDCGHAKEVRGVRAEHERSAICIDCGQPALLGGAA